MRFPVSLLLLATLGVASAFGGGCSDDAAPIVPTSDAGAPTVPDAGPVASTSPDAPFVGEVGKWGWTGIDGMLCGNGAGTGVGVSFGTSTRVVVFFEGGGACFDAFSCFLLKTATYVETGYGEATFAERMSDVSGSMFDRALASNPFKDDTFVYVPYCTGDVHAGAKVTEYPGYPAVHHVGRTNADLVLRRVVASFKTKTDRVLVTGSSAGGFGAALLYDRFARAFAPTRVDLLDDSGPPIPAAKSVYLSQWNESWDLFSAFPEGCTDCRGEPAKVVPYLARTYPASRFGLLSYDQDGTISRFYSLDGPGFRAAIKDIQATQFAPLPNGRLFVASGTQHTMLGNLGTTSEGVVLSTWLRQMATDDAAWANVLVPEVR